MSYLIKDFKDILSKRRLIMTMAEADFRKKFIGSYFGVFWMFVPPIVTVLIYYCVFQLGFKSNPVTDMPYVLWLIPGIVPWFFFNEAWGSATACLYEYQHLVKKMVFKVSILPIVKVSASLFVHFIFIWIMLAVYLLFGEKPSLWWFQLFYYTFCTAFLLLGLSFFTASINVFFKDMSQIVQVFLQFGMWIVPIMWPSTMMSGVLLSIVKLNPIYYIVEGYRDCFISQVGFWEHKELTIYFWVVSIGIFAVGSTVFKRLKPHFADVL